MKAEEAALLAELDRVRARLAQAEAALRESRRQADDEARRLVALVEQSTDFIGLADSAGQVRFVNAAGCAMVGLEGPAAARALPLADVLIPADRATLQDVVLPTVRHAGLWAGPLHLRHLRSGAAVAVLFSMFPIRDAQGAVSGYGTVSRDIREQLQADRRRAALVEVGDRLASLEDPAEMAYAAAEIMARALGASRAGYGSVDAVAQSVEILRDWTAPGTASIAGRYRFADYGAYFADLQRGETVVFNDVAQDPRTAANAGMWHALGTTSVINLPILEHGAMVAVFFLHQDVPRDWSAAEVAFVRDVAERTRSAIERRRAEHGLRALAAALEQQVAARTEDLNRLWRLSGDIMLITGFDGTILAVNPAATAVLGWAEQDLLGRSAFDLVHPDDRTHSRARAASLAAGETVAPVERRYRHRDGSFRWISWTAVSGGGRINAVGRDFTREREKTAALADSEARLRAVFETSYSFQSLLSPDGTLLDANPASLAAIGAAHEAVIGRKFWDTPWFSGTPGMAEMVAEAIPQVAAGATVRREIVIDLPTGRRAFDFSMRPVRDAAGAVIYIVPEAMELTERRAAEEQLRQAQKMEAVGQLTGGLAHDFNNILTGIAGSLELLQLRAAQGRLDGGVLREGDRYLSAALGATRRAAALTHRLLAFSRQQPLDPRPVEPNRLIGDMTELLRRTIGPQITLTAALAQAAWPILCDPNQLENALLNLCINARDAMPEGGRLTIETANVWLDDAGAGARDMAPGQYVCISVTDTGMGMSREVLARAFDPFFTTKKLGEGTGLGLSMIYGFARQSDGAVRLHSEPGHGTSARLYLPRHAGPLAEAAPASADGETAVGAGESVLVVDDEPVVRMLVADVLGDLGYGALEAEDGQAALAILRSPARVDLLVTDIGLPGGMNGRQLAEAARELRPALPVLFITGYAEAAVLGGQQPAGMQVLAKPFAMDALAARIRAMVAK